MADAARGVLAHPLIVVPSTLPSLFYTLEPQTGIDHRNAATAHENSPIGLCRSSVPKAMARLALRTAYPPGARATGSYLVAVLNYPPSGLVLKHGSFPSLSFQHRPSNPSPLGLVIPIQLLLVLCLVYWSIVWTCYVRIRFTDFVWNG